MRNGILSKEVQDSRYYRYNSTFWNGQTQPIQDIDKQYECYLKDGYSDEYFKNIKSHTPHFGVWITCFVAFLHKDKSVQEFLDLWYLQTLKYTTQDQMASLMFVRKPTCSLLHYLIMKFLVHGHILKPCFIIKQGMVCKQ